MLPPQSVMVLKQYVMFQHQDLPDPSPREGKFVQDPSRADLLRLLLLLQPQVRDAGHPAPHRPAEDPREAGVRHGVHEVRPGRLSLRPVLQIPRQTGRVQKYEWC